MQGSIIHLFPPFNWLHVDCVASSSAICSLMPCPLWDVSSDTDKDQTLFYESVLESHVREDETFDDYLLFLPSSRWNV